MSERYARWSERAAALHSAGLRRQLRSLALHSPTVGVVAGQAVQVFSSNDYLGLAEHPELKAAMASGGAGGARLISGNRYGHDALEAELSAWLGRETTLFTSGFMANMAVCTALLEAGDVVVSDAANHASIIDGLRLGRAERRVIPHGQTALPADSTAVIVEGLFSMDGDRAPLSAYPRAPLLIVDEAHAVGCIGPEGRGVAAALGLEPDVLVGTLGKAFGAAGAFVSGPPAVRELLVSSARSFIFTTAMPEGVALAARVGLRLADAARRDRLRQHVGVFREALQREGVTALGSDHIVPIVTGKATMGIAAALLERGYLVGAVRYPTVPVGQERLRVTLSAEHSPAQLHGLAETLAHALSVKGDSGVSYAAPDAAEHL